MKFLQNIRDIFIVSLVASFFWVWLYFAIFEAALEAVNK